MERDKTGSPISRRKVAFFFIFLRSVQIGIYLLPPLLLIFFLLTAFASLACFKARAIKILVTITFGRTLSPEKKHLNGKEGVLCVHSKQLRSKPVLKEAEQKAHDAHIYIIDCFYVNQRTAHKYAHLESWDPFLTYVDTKGSFKIRKLTS